MKKLPLLLFILFSHFINAREGMWLPHLLGKLNEPEMKAMGMKISAEDIYSINRSSLKDAVLQFGGGCTGEMVSSKGLLITNHHCGFSQIQSLSTIEKNYLKDGFWADKQEDEIPCPGLTVTFIREIKDVTAVVLKNVNDTINEDSRAAIIKFRSDSLEKSVEKNYKGIVRSFYFGNQYLLFIAEVFSDVRFVGAPPESVGKFGGETDNWIWPRHNADFSLFRIYAGKDNKPAAYSKENVPYVPLKYFTINSRGVQEDDFVFVYGFPGRTNSYLMSPGLELVAEQTNPNRIEIRNCRLDILREAMSKNDTIKLQYAPRFATLENAYKKWTGEQEGFSKFDVLAKKRMSEKRFMDRIKNIYELSKDTSLFSDYKRINDSGRHLNFANDFFADGFSGIELLNISMRFKPLITLCNDSSASDSSITAAVNKLKNEFVGFYKNYNSGVDKKTCAAIFKLASSKMDREYLPEQITATEKNDPEFSMFTSNLYKNSLAADSSKLFSFLSVFNRNKGSVLENDPAYLLMADLNEIQFTIQSELSRIYRELNIIQRNYLRDLLATDTTGKIYPDANSTLRISYGVVKGLKPRDGVRYDFYTTSEGILEKAKTGLADYNLPKDFTSLLQNRNFGSYGKNGVLPVAFIANTHTTGGNSGSPCMNANGELVGINFDRAWDGIQSDYYFDENYCRNICVDIRYVLFIIDRYGKANRLMKELKIVN